MPFRHVRRRIVHRRWLHHHRKHLLDSLDDLLYKLLGLSFLLSPGFWRVFARVCAQGLSYAPHEIYPPFVHRRLPLVHSSFVIFCSFFAIWYHAFYGPVLTRPDILDFTGRGYTPSRFQLLAVDFTILFLQLIQGWIAYELELEKPFPDSLSETAETEASYSLDDTTSPDTDTDLAIPKYIVDLRWSAFLARLRQTEAPAVERRTSAASLLPTPNRAMWPAVVPSNMRLFMRMGAFPTPRPTGPGLVDPLRPRPPPNVQ